MTFICLSNHNVSHSTDQGMNVKIQQTSKCIYPSYIFGNGKIYSGGVQKPTGSAVIQTLVITSLII